MNVRAGEKGLDNGEKLKEILFSCRGSWMDVVYGLIFLIYAWSYGEKSV